jgi:hypothetical protein
MLQNTFIRRLFYYLIGFGLGLILVFLFFGNKGCSWLPSNQVRDVISKKILISTSNKFHSNNISKLLENAEIDFDKSDKQNSNKTYYFELKNDKIDIESFFISFNSDSYFAVIHETQNELKKYTNDTIFKIILIPSGTNSLINYEETNPIQNELIKNKLDYKNYNITLIKSGYLNYNFLKPNNKWVKVILKDKMMPKKIFYSWENYVLTPLKIEK